MTNLLKDLDAVALLADRLDQLSDAVAKQRWNEFSMRVPAEPARDADLVLASVARFIRTHHATIAQNAEDLKRLKALELAFAEFWASDKPYEVEQVVTSIEKRADEIMRDGER